MNELTRNEIVRRFQAGQSGRQIARELHVSRHTIRRVLVQTTRQRHEGNVPKELHKKAKQPRPIDAFVDVLQDLLRRYPQLTAQRLWEELRKRGFSGGYKQVWSRVRELRPKPGKQPVVRFETGPGQQAQMDYSVCDIDFTQEGRRRVYLFSYVLGYSRRAYLRFVQSQDFETTVREHIHAFTHLGGAAATCLYDNMKTVVLRHEDGEPIYNPRFLAFATHYGFQPRACRPRRPQTKGKVERFFDYVSKSLLAGRTFDTLDHLNEVTAWWLANVADVRIHGETKKTPLELHTEEQPHLLVLPACAYNVDAVIYRTVNAEGFIAWRGNLYAVPLRHIGQLLPVRLTETELILYTPAIEELTRQPLLPRHVSGQKSGVSEHHPSSDGRLEHAQLEERFTTLGAVALRFFHGLLQQQRYGRHQAHKVLTLLNLYARKDVLAALERAVRYGAYSAQAVERILAVAAQPKSILEHLAEQEHEHLDPLLRDNPVSPRPTSEYQALFSSDPSHDDTPLESTSEGTHHGQETTTPQSQNDNSQNISAGPEATSAQRPKDSQNQPGKPDAR